MNDSQKNEYLFPQESISAIDVVEIACQHIISPKTEDMEVEPQFVQQSLEELALPRLEDQGTIFICPHPRCDKQFLQRCNLNQHIRTHSGDRPYECELCTMRFKQQGHLQTHIRSLHTDEKPFPCPIETCSQSFHQLGNLDGHVRRCHRIKELKVPKSKTKYICKCGALYMTKGTLRNHWRKMHEEEASFEEDGPHSSNLTKETQISQYPRLPFTSNFASGQQRVNLVRLGMDGQPQLVRVFIVPQSTLSIERPEISSLPPEPETETISGVVERDNFEVDDFMSVPDDYFI